MRNIYNCILWIYVIFLVQDIWVNVWDSPLRYGVVACLLVIQLFLWLHGARTKRFFFTNRLVCVFLITGMSWLAGPLFLIWHIILATEAILTILGRLHLVLVGLSFLGYAGYLAFIREWSWPLAAGMLWQVLFESMTFVFIILLIYSQRHTILQRQETEKLYSQLKQSHQRLEQYAREVETLGAMEERSRIAREIHDSLGHTLTALIMQIEAGKLCLDKDVAAARARVSRAEELARDAMLNLREAVRALRREDFGDLKTGICTLAASLGLSGPAFLLELHGEQVLSQPVQSCLYRLAQEGLTNAVRHGKASRVTVQISCTPQRITMLISDDGVGAKEPMEKGFGLRGMEERLAELGGFLKISTESGHGFRLKAELPGRGMEHGQSQDSLSR